MSTNEKPFWYAFIHKKGFLSSNSEKKESADLSSQCLTVGTKVLHV